MRLPVYLYGHPVLRKITTPVTPDYEGFKELIDNMFSTMYDSEGVGLAAPQIGLGHSIVVIDADPVKDSFPECAGRRLVLVNPEIEVLDGEAVSREEGCLSLPGLSEKVSRVENIRMRWLDENFEEHDEVFTGFLSRIIQHECDHLQGKLYIDHISMIRKQLIKSKLNNIIAGKVLCDYPVKYAPKKR